MEPVIRRLRRKYGPIVTLRIGSRPAIFITDHAVAHRAFIQSRTAFASRPVLETTKVLLTDQHTLTSAPYGSLWRVLRKNFISCFHHSRLRLYGSGRKWALDILKDKLLADENLSNGILVQDHFRHMFFSVLAYMVFGEKLEENAIREIEALQRITVVNFNRFNVLNFMPRLGKIVFRSLWKELLEIRRNQELVLLPYIRARREKIIASVKGRRMQESPTTAEKMSEKAEEENKNVPSYVDTLLDLQLPQEYGRRKLSEEEIVSLCLEFLNAGTDTTISTIQWVMANLVKCQEKQERLLREINMVARKGEEMREEDFKKMPYLRAVVLETIRRHPPSHFIIWHAALEDTELDGYAIPKNAMVNATVAEMGWDPSVWEDPLEFKPERFLGENGEVECDLKGVKQIKMMPFGVGIRACPAISMAFLHLEYFVANLVREYSWTAVDGEDVDLTEKQDFTIVMKNPLRVHICPRIH
ncbi:hypothetical protein RJ639_034149 [Escallonia herrerae]|uniref:Cytochrome P450 n=1 Tax=Escallonia herrerae TaxID=1293975 RepID=A0AA89BFS1_9ASTE|nr:hypothetical protein RJ639_034149 [Escallonia herrerae]